ncbi:MAG: outer membrane beta-barrel protein [Paracoccaceae bacterium]
MKKLTLCALSALSLTTAPAMAGDLSPVGAEAGIASPSSHGWTGPYAGVHLGYGDGQYKQADFSSMVLDDEPAHRLDGFLGGVTLGYNVQSGNLVYGVEGDLALAGIKGTNSDIPGWYCSPGIDGCHNSIEALGTLRGRVGMARDTMLLYATGGFAVARINTGDTTGAAVGVFTHSDKTETGWTAGFGLEKAISGRSSIKAEILYVDLGETRVEATRYVTKNDFVTVRLGFNQSF